MAYQVRDASRFHCHTRLPWLRSLICCLAVTLCCPPPAIAVGTNIVDSQRSNELKEGSHAPKTEKTEAAVTSRNHTVVDKSSNYDDIQSDIESVSDSDDLDVHDHHYGQKRVALMRSATSNNLETENGCCFTIGYGAMMTPCCLSSWEWPHWRCHRWAYHRQNTGGTVGWSQTCPPTAAEALTQIQLHGV
mmetsp:Transcript_17768/g.26855  ORF Transcript_17768/g.26855 Transcript_17768/m.26855 type:complete len:190 (+) Transcript_17768:126-695(+)|eukprot:CAMPEP_0206579434 /NCGR_PEP_ID=MMETSP0325_2-20121206/32549_1 /ASSEMBLY_ACC=CAM_ASM_000347 /TAXON_ID=2866 /ORGANISM="Crypthecodinium cohnii, Strain Seligo" /LENGTH=189 /DNA_ID=CAMNT_0054085249 /DNA_START=142 /DNA_END=711 /DNA_ORIENTATION=+